MALGSVGSDTNLILSHLEIASSNHGLFVNSQNSSVILVQSHSVFPCEFTQLYSFFNRSHSPDLKIFIPPLFSTFAAVIPLKVPSALTPLLATVLTSGIEPVIVVVLSGDNL